MVSHTPVMLREVLKGLSPKDGGVYVDATFGGGGHTRAILESANCRVIGLDRDPDAVSRGKILQRENNRFSCHQSRLSNLRKTLLDLGIDGVDGILFDLGVSSFQLDTAERGFSFMRDANLDMRMEKDGMTAMEFLNDAGQDEIMQVIRTYGEEKNARKIARTVVEKRPVRTTLELAEMIRDVYHINRKKSQKRVHPATRTFQALRMYVNDEMGELEKGLEDAKTVLKPDGKLAILTFHSLEDRAVKQFFARESVGERGSRHLPEKERFSPNFEITRPAKVLPSEEEIKENPRARSARLRVGKKLKVKASAALPFPDHIEKEAELKPGSSGFLFFISTPYFLNHFMKGFLS